MPLRNSIMRTPLCFETSLLRANGSSSPTCSRNGAESPPSLAPSRVRPPGLYRPSGPNPSSPNATGEKERMNERLEPKTSTQPRDPTETQFHSQPLALTELRRFIRSHPTSNMSETDAILTLLTTTCHRVARRAGYPSFVKRF